MSWVLSVETLWFLQRCCKHDFVLWWSTSFTVDVLYSFHCVITLKWFQILDGNAVFSGLFYLLYLDIFSAFLYFVVPAVTLWPASTFLCISNNPPCKTQQTVNNYMSLTKFRGKNFASVIFLTMWVVWIIQVTENYH